MNDRARAMLLAIAMQESNLKHRSQLTGPSRTWWSLPRGPANGWWQFEKNGVEGVLDHQATKLWVRRQVRLMEYPADTKIVHTALQYDSILAFLFARALLWTVPDSLPGENEQERAWQQYLFAWRPGKPHKESWESNYAVAWEVINGSN